MSDNPRDLIGRTLTGDVLEVGPGHIPFPTAPGARVTFADRSVPGGRDATWPELRDAPRGPDADLDLNLDVDGLAGIADRSLDVVIASHVIEHLANPIAALREFERALRPGGRLVLVVPDRHRTFDAVRAPTSLAHVLAELEAGVTEVDDDHIREFCTAIYGQPPIHPDEVREWHDPHALDAARLDLHRRRSIHVHCWDAEEFAALIVGTLAAGLASWELESLYLSDDLVDEPSIEFGLVLTRAADREGAAEADEPRARAERFVRVWAGAVLTDDRRDPAHAARFAAALRRDLPTGDDLIDLPALALADEVAARRAATTEVIARLAQARADLSSTKGRADNTADQLDQLRRSRSYRAARLLGAPVRFARDHKP